VTPEGIKKKEKCEGERSLKELSQCLLVHSKLERMMVAFGKGSIRIPYTKGVATWGMFTFLCADCYMLG